MGSAPWVPAKPTLSWPGVSLALVSPGAPRWVAQSGAMRGLLVRRPLDRPKDWPAPNLPAEILAPRRPLSSRPQSSRSPEPSKELSKEPPLPRPWSSRGRALPSSAYLRRWRPLSATRRPPGPAALGLIRGRPCRVRAPIRCCIRPGSAHANARAGGPRLSCVCHSSSIRNTEPTLTRVWFSVAS